MFKKRQAKGGRARKQTLQIQATNNAAAPLLSFGGGADEDEGPTFEVKKRKLRRKGGKSKAEPAPAPAPPASSDYSAAGLAALRGAQTALPAELAEESAARAAEEAARDEPEEPAEDPAAAAARARRARVARASSRAATEELDRTATIQDFDARAMSDDDSDDGLGGRAAAEDFVPVPGKANKGVAARLQDEARQRWLKAGADAGDVDAPAAPGGAMDAALRKAGGAMDDDDDELLAHEAELARRGANTRVVAGAPLPHAAPRRRPTTYADVYATVTTRADELETESGEWEPRRRLREAADHAKAEAAGAERQVEARRAAVQAWESSVNAANADKASASLAVADLDKARRIIEEAEAACGSSPDEAALARLRAALAEAAAVVATAAADDGGAPSDFFAVYASDVPAPYVPATPAVAAAAPAGASRARAGDFF